ncbi:SnoaL-like domain protein [Pseudovibrio sp. Ad13]|uniref:nuclear transport factor 2 family protein n=2 Tax=unclassified Pseudovibrio TaxID=2627060 RepID=UPI0007B26D75|nr:MULTISPECIES: nuclear transport factor 2 family protein [unclassified Pseudovibrio]KZK75926.1 SnoaL-like domain protein [Pseudovibrio sp. Ad13]
MMSTPYSEQLQKWLDMLEGGKDLAKLSALIAKDCVFYSPVVHTPQRGQQMTVMYLYGAAQVLGVNNTFKYVRILDCGDNAVLEFETEVDGIYINGVDMIHWNEGGLIDDFKVMLRPLKAVTMVQAKMAEMLEGLKAPAKAGG